MIVIGDVKEVENDEAIIVYSEISVENMSEKMFFAVRKEQGEYLCRKEQIRFF